MKFESKDGMIDDLGGRGITKIDFQMVWSYLSCLNVRIVIIETSTELQNRMSNLLFNSHEGSCSSVGMDPSNDNADHEAEIEKNMDEMSEEELERIEEQPNEDGGEEQGGDPTLFERKKRIRKSIVWDNMKIVKLKNGTEKVQCNHCKEYFNKSASGTTSQHKHHLRSCLQKKLGSGSGDQTNVKQQILSFTNGQSDDISSITNFSYDHAKLFMVRIEAVAKIVEIKVLIYELYNEYVEAYISSHAEDPKKQQLSRQNRDLMSKRVATKKLGVNVLTGKEKFLMHVTNIDKTPPEKLDLDVYLEENRYSCGDVSVNLDVLAWWKSERLRFPILSKMASDILSILVTSVASESTFSAGGRVIDDRRASMIVEIVQMLLCGNDWIRNVYGIKTRPRDSLDVAESSTYHEVELPNQN
ncbi:hypothetical protein ACS0TY_027777 [Phlomoides rotata]